MRIEDDAELGELVRKRRRELRLSQAALAEQVGVSRQWLVEVEKGKPRAEIGLVLRTLHMLGVKLFAEPSARAPAATPRARRMPDGSGRGHGTYGIGLPDGSRFGDPFLVEAVLRRARGKAQ